MSPAPGPGSTPKDPPGRVRRNADDGLLGSPERDPGDGAVGTGLVIEVPGPDGGRAPQGKILGDGSRARRGCRHRGRQVERDRFAGYGCDGVGFAATPARRALRCTAPSCCSPATASTTRRAHWVLGLELRDTDPGDILAVPLGDGRFAYAGDLNRLYRAWVGERMGALDVTTLIRLDGAVRAALDL